MSAVQKMIEGTWEEILQHAPELAGHRLRVTVLDRTNVTSPATTTDVSADAWVRSLYEWAHNRAPVPTVLDDSRDSIYADRLDHQL